MELKELIALWKQRADNHGYKGNKRQELALEFFVGAHAVHPLPEMFLVCLSVGRKPEEFLNAP